jgi:hypothetical protein
MAQMTITSAIEHIQQATHDISGEFSHDDCLRYLNSAISEVSALLISINWTGFVKEATVKDGDTLPDNYMKAAGTYPLRMTDGKVKILDDVTSVRFRYFATSPKLTGKDQYLPFTNDAINEIVVNLATMKAMNEISADLTQDSALFKSLEEAVANGIGNG